MSARSERALLALALGGGLPALVVALVALARGGTSPTEWMIAVVLVLTWLGAALMLRSRTAFRLRTISNLLAAVREGDYSFRVRGGSRRDAFGELVLELNLLAEALRGQRLGDVEGLALLRKVMAEIDVAFFALDPAGRVRLVNPAGERLLGRGSHEVLGEDAASFGLDAFLAGPPAGTVELGLPGGSGRWELRRGTFRQEGRPLTLLVLSDVSRALRAEELAAWRRLIRVIGHELNNSLAPIKSIAASLEKRARTQALPDAFRDDLASGLKVIGARADALSRFMTAYAMLAKMPEPSPRPVEIGPLVERVRSLETRLPVALRPGPPVSVAADPDQLEQALINLVRNAADAALPAGGAVCLSWSEGGGWLEIVVDDEGPGLADTRNLFVPFFSTKRGGSGIGLVLCRQIAEGHGGAVALVNREDRSGCRATLRLPSARRLRA